jgi:hypothetical protein
VVNVHGSRHSQSTEEFALVSVAIAYKTIYGVCQASISMEDVYQIAVLDLSHIKSVCIEKSPPLSRHFD